MKPVGCALCGAPASRRIDLTYSIVDQQAIDGYTVQSVLRGALICISCADTKPIGEAAAQLKTGVAIVRGCLVQCANNPPRHLRITRPHGARPWRKVICPNCHGRASVQWLGDAVKIWHRFDWAGGFRQALRVFSWRQLAELEQQQQQVQAEVIPEDNAIIIGASGDDAG